MSDYTIDAKEKKLGRLASEIALLLEGKNKADYEPRLDNENKVIIKNISQIGVSGKKFKDKTYYRHSTRIGHLIEETMEEVWKKKGPAEVLRRAVFGMLPKNKLRVRRLKRLIIE